jgi:LacI family transcriptional regulator
VPTIRDVAREAGVSVATVSRVFNGSSLVSQGTALTVIAAAAALDYSPNGAARSLSTKRTHVLGVLLPDLHGEFFSEIIRGIDHGTRAERYQVILSSSHASASEMISVARSLRGRIDGLIVMAPDAGSARAIGDIARYFPVVLLNPGLRVPLCSAVSIANARGATSVVHHLASLGHRRIAVISGPTENVDARERLKGYRRALRESGSDISERLEIPGDFHELSGYRSARDILALRPRPTAVFAANDYMAIGLLRALAEAGVRVPDDIAVAGFDDIPLAQYLAPPLTTVRVDSYELGERAVRLWFEYKRSGKGGEGHRHELLPTELVVRSSCGARERPAGSSPAGGFVDLDRSDLSGAPSERRGRV